MGMNWDNYLLEEKAPCGWRAGLGVLDGEVSGVYDLSLLPENTRILNLATPLKKSKLKYTNYEALIGNEEIEGICVTDIDEERIAVFSTLPNLKYFRLRNNKQEEIPNLSCLKSLKVLILMNIARAKDIEFISGMSSLKTLYICDINNLHDLSPLSRLAQLCELSLENGGMNGVGNPVKSLEPLAALTELQYLHLGLTVENRNYDVTSLFSLKKLQKLSILPRFLKDGRGELLLRELPLVEEIF